MRKEWIVVAAILTIALFVVTGTAQAAVTKYTFNDVDIDGTIVEIEASVKETNKAAFSTCSYFADDYREFLGTYEDAVVGGTTADEVLAFCIGNFTNRDTG
ncbi:MAG: hypothetical protein RRC07_02165 [Anaerolineae bacterium]|nr:hypothetical protein [Anaerolineae bacterium]